MRFPQYTGSRGPRDASSASRAAMRARHWSPIGLLAPEVQVVLGHLALALLADRAPSQDVVEKGHDVVGPLGSAEGHDEQRIVGGHPSDLNRW